MTASVVLVDTSAWVEFFNRPDGAHHAAVADLLDLDRVAVTGVIAAELLRGCRSEHEMDELEDALGGVLRLELAFADWVAVGRDMGKLRQRGVTVSLSDASIAHAARHARIPLYALDADFGRHWPDLDRFPTGASAT